MVRDWREIPYQRYLTEALTLSATEEVRLATALSRLPEDIVDSHTHVARLSDVIGLPDSTLAHVVTTYPCYTLQDGSRVRAHLWPGKRVRALRMALPIEGYLHREINEYLVTQAALQGDVVAGYGIPDDVDYTRHLIDGGQIRALKMYHRYREPGAEHILDVFPIPVLQLAQERGIPVIMHLPNPLPDSLDELTDVLRSFPELTVVLAHLGGAGGQRFHADVVPAYRHLSLHNRVFLDTALVLDSELIAVALNVFGADRILFGSDEPLSLIRGVNYVHTVHGDRLYAPGYHWALDDDAPPEAVRSAERTLLHIQQIEAVLAALESSPGDAIGKTFYHNATQLFGLPRRDTGPTATA